MAHNYENLNVCQRLLPFNVKVGIWPANEVVRRKALLQRVSVMALSMIAGIQR